MHKWVFRILGIWLLFASVPLPGESKSGVVINGSLNSNIDLLHERLFPDAGSALSWGWTNYVNLRLKSQLQDGLSFNLAINLSTLSGYYAAYYAALTGTSVPIPELERLYFKAGSDYIDVEAGLIRIPRGYGFVFSPLDIFNLRDATNSLDPQARPKGKWAIHTTFYPQDMWKLELFAVAPDNPQEKEVWDSKFGCATTFSLGKVNWDLLYTLFLPEVPYNTAPPLPYMHNNFVHAAGFAFKADIEIGLFAEALYRLDYQALNTGLYYGKDYQWYHGLEAALGADYTLPATNVYLLAEYLFYGSGQVDWDESRLDSLYMNPAWETLDLTARASNPAALPLPYARHDYLFLLSRYAPEQDLRIGISCLMGLDDLSALITAFGEYDLLQGLTLQASYLLPVDKKLFDNTAPAGEWGSTRLGFHELFRLGAKVKI